MLRNDRTAKRGERVWGDTGTATLMNPLISDYKSQIIKLMRYDAESKSRWMLLMSERGLVWTLNPSTNVAVTVNSDPESI